MGIIFLSKRNKNGFLPIYFNIPIGRPLSNKIKVVLEGSECFNRVPIGGEDKCIVGVGN